MEKETEEKLASAAMTFAQAFKRGVECLERIEKLIVAKIEEYEKRNR
jgi:hypothetical protein